MPLKGRPTTQVDEPVVTAAADTGTCLRSDAAADQFLFSATRTDPGFAAGCSCTLTVTVPAATDEVLGLREVEIGFRELRSRSPRGEVSRLLALALVGVQLLPGLLLVAVLALAVGTRRQAGVTGAPALALRLPEVRPLLPVIPATAHRRLLAVDLLSPSRVPVVL